MFASVIQVKAKSGQMESMSAATIEKLPEISQIPGIKQVISVDLGNDEGISIIVYESQEAQEASASKAAEILGGLAGFFAAPPDRKGCPVIANETF